jgi:hypothetical protein
MKKRSDTEAMNQIAEAIIRYHQETDDDIDNLYFLMDFICNEVEFTGRKLNSN